MGRATAARSPSDSPDLRRGTLRYHFRQTVTMRTPDRRTITVAAGLDVLAVLVFVVIGRRNHQQGNALDATVETALPFRLGVAVAWAATRAWRRPTALLTAIAIWPLTVLVGMLLRRWWFDGGTATAFVVVATMFLGASFVGWRAVHRVRVLSRRSLPRRVTVDG